MSGPGPEPGPLWARLLGLGLTLDQSVRTRGQHWRVGRTIIRRHPRRTAWRWRTKWRSRWTPAGCRVPDRCVAQQTAPVGTPWCAAKRWPRGGRACRWEWGGAAAMRYSRPRTLTSILRSHSSTNSASSRDSDITPALLTQTSMRRCRRPPRSPSRSPRAGPRGAAPPALTRPDRNAESSGWSSSRRTRRNRQGRFAVSMPPG